MQAYSGAPTKLAVGMTSGNMMAKVPHDDPVAKLSIAESTKMAAGSIQTGRAASVTPEIKTSAPRLRPISESAHASSRVTATSVMFVMPFR